jgi:hypothetical protein
MTAAPETFSIDTFERLAYARDHEGALRELVTLLHSLDAALGHLRINGKVYAPNDEAAQAGIVTRVTAALSCLFADPDFELGLHDWDRMISWHRWIGALFAASGFGNADHVLRAINAKKDGKGLEVPRASVLKFFMLYTSDSDVRIDAEGMWRADPRLTAALFLVLLTPRFVGSPAAHGKRELLLGWLPGKLAEIDTYDMLPRGVLNDVYMHCSYADRPDKHAIKKPLNALFRRALAAWGVTDLAPAARKTQDGKPILLVVLEYFSVNHSIYRTHSATLRAARDRFHIIGMGLPRHVDEHGRAIFHEFVELTGDLTTTLKQVHAVADERRPAALYMPSVGMFQLTMYLATLRLAPLQLLALGHPATTHSDAMDYVVVEEDYVGDPACFSEKLLVLPRDGLPYIPSGFAETIEPIFNENPEVVKIAVCAAVMKINPQFLATLARIAQAAQTKVEFHILVGFAHGLTAMHVKKVLRQYLGDHARVYAHLPYGAYMDVVRQCDLFLNPFPFGNTNGIVDTVSAGLVGVCRTGREVHEHIDEGLFRRLGLPEWTITRTSDDYVAAAVRLIDNPAERIALRKAMLARDGVKTLFKGRPEIFGERLLALVRAGSGKSAPP